MISWNQLHRLLSFLLSLSLATRANSNGILALLEVIYENLYNCITAVRYGIIKFDFKNHRKNFKLNFPNLGIFSSINMMRYSRMPQIILLNPTMHRFNKKENILRTSIRETTRNIMNI